jgi:hypothetical protein
MDDRDLTRRLELLSPPDLESARRRARLAARTSLLRRGTAPVAAPRVRSRRLGLTAAGAGLAVALIVPALLLFGGGGEVQPAVGQVLRQAADVAADQVPATPPGPGQYLFTRSREADLSEFVPAASKPWSVVIPQEREIWLAPDGSGRLRATSDRPRFISPAQRAEWVAAGSPSLAVFNRPGQVSEVPLSGGPGFLDTPNLPTDPKALRRLIEARKVPGIEGPPGEVETFVLIGDMLRESYLPPTLRAALYEVTAELPGVELLGEVQDPAGRAGVGVAFTDERRGVEHELILSEATSALLAEREIVVGTKHWSSDFPPGTEIGSATYLESRVVDSVGEGVPAGAPSARKP